MPRKLSSVLPSPAMALAFLALLAACTGAAIAASSNGSVIRACANRKTGVLRLASKCRHGERSVSWDKAGVAGPAGATGATGPQGPGAETFRSRLATNAPETTLTNLSNGVQVTGACHTGRMNVMIRADGTVHLQAFGGASSDGGAVMPISVDGSSVVYVQGKSEVMFDGVVQNDTRAVAPGPVFARLDIRGLVDEQACVFEGMTIPSDSQIAGG